MSPSRIDIMRLALVGKAHDAVIELAAQHPDAIITSGRRSREVQAHAMAENIIASTRQWINRTYKVSAVREACQQWVTDNPAAVSIDALAAGLLHVLEQFDVSEVSKLSKHLSGEAFDVQPVRGLSGMLLLNALRNVVHKYGGTLIEIEGGIIRWHAQF